MLNQRTSSEMKFADESINFQKIGVDECCSAWFPPDALCTKGRDLQAKLTTDKQRKDDS